MNPEGRKFEEPTGGEIPVEEAQDIKAIHKEPYIIEKENSVSFLGVEVPKASGGRLVPGIEEFKEEYTFIEGHYQFMREAATALLLNKPILFEGGTGVYNKTTTIAYICKLLSMNYCKVNFGRETAVEDVMGGKEPETDEHGHEKFEWYNGRLMDAIEHGGIAFLDEYNRQSRLHEIVNPVIDAILNGRKEIVNPLNKSKTVKVHPDFRLIAAQNPPGFEGGHTYEGRNPLPTETFGRWVFKKLPPEYTSEERNKRLAGMIGENVEINLPASEFRMNVPSGEELSPKSGEYKTPEFARGEVRTLAGVPGMINWRREMVSIFEVLQSKSSGAKKEMAKGQKQELSINPRLENTILEYIARFYKGDINETVNNAFETCVVGMYSSEADRKKIREMLNQAAWKPPVTESKRKGLERGPKEEESLKGEGPETLQEVRKRAEKARESLFKNPKVPDEIKERLKLVESSAELESSLQEQYERQVEVLEKAGLLRKLESGQLGIEGIDGKEYAIPTQAEIVERIEAKKELVERKQEQGFTKLLLVPFGMKLDDLIEAYKQRILDHSQRGKLFATKKDSGDPPTPLELNESQPLWKWDGYNNADATGELVYNPKEFSKNHKGKTKQEILEKQGGWQVLLIEDMSNIPREGGAKTKGGRTQIDTGGSSIKKYIKRGENIPSPAEYLKALNKEPAYNGESGMTPEEHIIYAITHLKETDEVVDDWQGNGSISYQIGAYFPSSGSAPHAYWDRGNRRASIVRNDPDYRNDYCGVRPAVRL
ncbi:MAG: AAA family ATPase [Patescibacteria group bacterium]